MSLVLIPVKVKAWRADGTFVAGATVRAVLTVAETDDGIVVPANIVGVTDLSGEVTLNLWPNSRGVNGSQYRVEIAAATLYFSGLVTVPEAPDTAWPIDLATLINQPPYPTRSAAEVAQANAQTFMLQAKGYRDEAAMNAQAAGARVFPSDAAALSKGVVALSGLAAGAGGTNGTFDLAFSGGGGTGAAGRFVVSGGVVESVWITATGENYGAAPAVSFAASGGLSGAAAIAVIANNVDAGEYYWVPATDVDAALSLHRNVGGVATDTGKRIVDASTLDVIRRSSGARMHFAFSINAGTGNADDDTVLGGWSDDGLHDFTSGEDVLLTGAPRELESTSSPALFARRDLLGRDVEVIDAEGRVHLLGLGEVFSRVASTDIITAFERESFGDVSAKYFLMDKAKSALARRVRIQKTIVGADEDANTSFARFPYFLPITPTSGIVFFAQRHISDNNGEEKQRLVCRDYTIDPVAKTITTSATRVIYQHAAWAAGTGGYATGPRAVRLSSGNVVLLFDVLETGGRLDGGGEVAQYCAISADNGLTWPAALKVLGTAQMYGAGGITGGVPFLNGAYGGTGNSMLVIPTGPFAGRIVASITGPGVPWNGCMYSDDGGVNWTRGTMMNHTAQQYYEPAIEFTSDGSVVMFTRCDLNDGSPSPANLTNRGVGRFVSADGGGTFAFTGHVTTAPLANSSVSVVNASRAAATGFEKLLFAGPTTPVAYRRRDHQFFLSYDKGATAVAKAVFFPSEAGVGYGCLQRQADGSYLFGYETHYGVNQFNNVGLLYMNEAELLARFQLL